jgi:hypothetical protein
MSGVCSCTGNLERKTFSQAWASAGRKFNPRVPYASEECFQCVKCQKIYTLAMVTGQVDSLDQTDNQPQDFGITNGRMERKTW